MPISGERLFRAEAELVQLASVGVKQTRKALEHGAKELVSDITLKPSKELGLALQEAHSFLYMWGKTHDVYRKTPPVYYGPRPHPAGAETRGQDVPL